MEADDGEVTRRLKPKPERAAPPQPDFSVYYTPQGPPLPPRRSIMDGKFPVEPAPGPARPGVRCKFCDHLEADHRPPKEIDISKSGASSGKGVTMTVTATTACYSNPLCCCCRFIE